MKTTYDIVELICCVVIILAWLLLLWRLENNKDGSQKVQKTDKTGAKINLESLGFKNYDDSDMPQLCYSNSMGTYILNAMKTNNGYWIIIWHMGSEGIHSSINIGEFTDQDKLQNFITALRQTT